MVTLSPCPQCGERQRIELVAFEIHSWLHTITNYFRCLACDHDWHETEPDPPLASVQPRRPRKAPARGRL